MRQKTFGLFVLMLLLYVLISGYLPDNGKASAPSPALEARMESYCSVFFGLLNSDVAKPDYEVFKKAFTGFLNLRAANRIRKNLLTIIDFSLSSNLDRMWIVDMNEMKVVHANLVAHGNRSGEEYASHFSNLPASHQSSLGFYLTDNTYSGSHGLSLILEGVEPGINDRARERAIVMHGADYVSRKFIQAYGRLGRSFGCPSIPLEDHENIIRMLAGGSCLYIYYPDDNYLKNTRLLAAESAVKGICSFFNDLPGISAVFPGIFPEFLAN